MSSGSGRSSSGLKHSLIYFSTVVAGQGLAFLLLPFVTRAMTPAEYGDFDLRIAAVDPQDLAGDERPQRAGEQLDHARDLVDRGDAILVVDHFEDLPWNREAHRGASSPRAMMDASYGLRP